MSTNIAPTGGEGRGTGIPAATTSRPMSRDDMRIVWTEADLLPRLLKDVPRHQLMLTFNRHGGKKAKEFQAGLGELVEDESVLRKMPAIDFPLDAQNDSALWTVACIDIDAESPELLNPAHSHGSTEEASFYQTSLAKSTPAHQHLVWLMVNLPAPSMMHNAHVLATWELDVEGSEKKHFKTQQRHTGKQKKQKKVYPRVQLHEPGNVAIRPMAELSLSDRARLHAERAGIPKEQKEILDAKDELSQTGDVTVDDAVANDLLVAAEEGALDVPSNQRPPVHASAVNPNMLMTKAGSAPLSEQEEAQRIKHDPEARANPTQDELAALAMDTSGAPGEDEEGDEQEGEEELKGPHRLVFVVYRQNAKVPTRTLPEDSLSDSRHSFNLGRFIHQYPQIDSEQVWAASFLFVGAENEALLNEQRRYNQLMRPIEDQVRLPAGGAKHPRPAKAAGGFDASALKHNQIASSRPEKDDIEA